MGKQFPNVNSTYGAPMGRVEKGTPQTPKSVRVFRVRLNAGGYDDGGAYWGHGLPLFCATDGRDYRHFVRAIDRIDAIAALEIPAETIARLPAASLKTLQATTAAAIRAGIDTRTQKARIERLKTLVFLGYIVEAARPRA